MTPPYSLPGPEIYAGIERLGLAEDLQGWHSTHPIFAELVDELSGSNPRRHLCDIVEVGSWKGASAIHLARCRRNCEWIDGEAWRVICVDTWLGSLEHWMLRDKPGMAVPRDAHGYPSLYHQFLHNVAAAGFTERIVPVPLPSLIGADLLQRCAIRPQLLYLDGSHAYADVAADLAAWWPLVAPGGILFGDDFAFPGVNAAVMEFASAKPAGFRSLTFRDGNFWIMRKREAAA